VVADRSDGRHDATVTGCDVNASDGDLALVVDRGHDGGHRTTSIS
jgi:hypothetical protein